MDSRKLRGKSQGLGLIKPTVDDLLRARKKEIEEERKKIKEQKKEIRKKRRQEFEQAVKDYYHPEPVDEEELERKELARHRDYLRRLRERHDRGEI